MIQTLFCHRPSPVATGGRDFGGLNPPQTKLQARPNWNVKNYKSVEFLSL